jgi:SP family myo-inositol transporter-like MFS transporter 13
LAVSKHLPHFFIGALKLSKDNTGVISGVLVVLGDDLGGKEVTDSEKEAITALCAARALVGAILAGVRTNSSIWRSARWAR